MVFKLITMASYLEVLVLIPAASDTAVNQGQWPLFNEANIIMSFKKSRGRIPMPLNLTPSTTWLCLKWINYVHESYEQNQ